MNFIKRELARNLKIESEIPVLFVSKADGSKRLCMDFRLINAVTIKDANKAPLQEINRERLKEPRYSQDGCHRLRTREGDEKHTAFITEYWLYEWTTMCSAYAAYQQNSEES